MYNASRNKWIYKVSIFPFWQTKYEELLETDNKIWNRVNSLIKKEFYSNPVYNEKSLKTKMKSYDKKISTKFHGSVIPKEEGTPCVFFYK